MYNGCKMATFCDFLVSRSARVQRPDTSSGHLMVASCFILKLQRGVNARLQPVFIFFSGFTYVIVPALFLGTVRSNREASLSLVPLVRLHAHRSFAVIFPAGTLARFFPQTSKHRRQNLSIVCETCSMYGSCSNYFLV